MAAGGGGGAAHEAFCTALRALGVEVTTVGARIQLELVNDGPVTIILDVPV